MNTAATNEIADFDAILQRTLRCSRYVRNLLNSDAELLPWLREHYAHPCNATEIGEVAGPQRQFLMRIHFHAPCVACASA
ncbi:MAG: hypothetical protein WDM70_06305 [Nitrosomonadales bacterium]